MSPEAAAAPASSRASEERWNTPAFEASLSQSAFMPSSRLSFRIPQTDVQLAQLLLGRRRRRAGEQVLPALRLGESDNIPDGVDAGHQRHEAVEAERDAAVRRRSVLERVEEEAELGALLLARDLHRAEHLLLHFVAVDAHRAAADLPAVQHHVVGLGVRLLRRALDVLLVPVLRAGERVVA